MIERHRVRSKAVTPKGRQLSGVLGPAKAEFSEQSQSFGHEVARCVPLQGVAGSQSKKIAGGGVVQRFWLFQNPSAPTRKKGNIATFFNHDNGLGEQMRAVLRLEMLSRTARKRCDQSTNHASQQSQELGLQSILSVRKGLSKGGLVRKRRQRMDVCEEIIHQELQHRHWRNCLCIQDAIGRYGHERLGSVLRRWRRGEARRGNSLIDASSLSRFGSFGMLVRRPAPLSLAIEGTVNAQLAARATRHVRVVALDFAHAAHVTGASESRQLGVDGGIPHDASRPGHEMLLKLSRRQLGRGRDGHADCMGLGDGFGSGILQRMVILDGLSSIAGSLQDLQPIAGVGVGCSVLRRRRWGRCRHGENDERGCCRDG